MTNNTQHSEEWKKELKRGAFEVYGPLGMGIDYVKLKQFISQLLQSAREETEEAKGQAYWERNQILAALTDFMTAHLCRHPEEDKEWEDDWRWIVCVHGDFGQMTWHIHDDDKKYFEHLPIQGNHWDGHSTPEKYQRLEKIRHQSPN